MNLTKIPGCRGLFISMCLLAIFFICSSASGRPPKYLIIYHSNLYGTALNELIDLEESRGFNVVAYAIPDGINRDSVRLIIINEHNKKFLHYVLLIGAARKSTEGSEAVSNFASGNLIPTYYLGNFSRTKTAFDYIYSVINPAYSPLDCRVSRPQVAVGRIPATTLADLGNYVEKLSLYYSDTSSASWKNDILIVSSDFDRQGIGLEFPPPSEINTQLEAVANAIPASFEKSTIKYSQYSTYDARQTAVVSALNSGKALVYSMATGANPWNFSYMFVRGPGVQFDADSDLTANDRCSIIIGASCALGAADTVSQVGGVAYRQLAENFLFAPNKGAIAYIGASGGTVQTDDSKFLRNFNSRFAEYPKMALGDLFNYAKWTKNSFPTFDEKTLMMYTLYGDPSLVIATTGVHNKTTISLDFERGSLWPIEDSTYDPSLHHIGNDTAFKCLLPANLGGGWQYRVVGEDTSQTGNPYKSWIIYDNLKIPITDSTRFLMYSILCREHPDGIGRCGVNGVLKNGTKLSYNGIVDLYGNGIEAYSRDNRIGYGELPVFDLAPLIGDTLKQIILEYNSVLRRNRGHFSFDVGFIKFSRVWGMAPDVSQIDAPAWLAPCSSVVISISAEDADINWGDSLTLTWSADVGYFTDDLGMSVVYHAPNSPQWANIDVAVSDKGAHELFRHHPISIQEPPNPPVGCPAIYSFKNGQYQLENKILTGSLDTDRPSRITVDYYPLEASPNPKGKPIELRLAEDGEEQTFLYKASLIAYDISSLGPKEELAITNNGDLVAIHDPIKPIFAQRDNGFSVEDLINARDSNSFISYDKGSMIIGYDLREFYDDLIKPAKILEEEGGGGIQDPGDKDPIHHKVLAGETMGNILTIKEKSYQREPQLMGKVYPRVRSTLPVLVDFTPFITADNSHWFVTELSWEKSYRMDYTAFYRYRKLPQIAEIPIQSALENGTTNVTSLIRETDSTFYKLIPKKYVDLTFPSISVMNNSNVKLVLKTVGYYEKYTGVSQSTDEIDPPIDFQNYPNPFNATTKFLFTLPAASRVNLSVFNILGQKVIELSNVEYPAGRHELIWNGEDQSGHSISSGIYFAKITVGDKSASKRIVIVK